MAMESFVFIDTEKCEPGGKMNQERIPKKTSLGSEGRKKLSDITNSLQNSNSHSGEDDKLKRNSITAREYIEQLLKENVQLKQLLLERNKLIELTGGELTKMRDRMQDMEKKNRQLAQANTQMTAERNRDKDMLKTLNHEIGCQRALLAAKDQELQQEKLKKKQSQKHCTAKKANMKAEEDGGADTRLCSLNQKCQTIIQPESSAVEEQREVVEKTNDESEKVEGHVPIMRRGRPRTQSLGGSVANDQVTSKEKACNKRHSTDAKSENKKRRQSSKFQPTEDVFEVEDTISPMLASVDKIMEEASTSSTTEIKERRPNETPAVRRSIGRPVRSSTLKVPTYKEKPLNVKMRRPE